MVDTNQHVSTSEEKKKLFPIVAIGASSGGLQALYELLENLPSNLGMAYVVIQHLSPTHESILPELLARKTKMTVHLVEEGMHIKPDNVYVIPPNTYMSIVDSVLILIERVKTKGGYYSIDFFLNALAPVYQAKAIAIILSGSGTDGTLGIQTIKAYGGITFAQDETASFSGMPKAAADSGFTDFVLPCDRIAQELTSIVQNPRGNLTMNELVDLNEDELKKIQRILHNKKGVDFSFYKQTTINRRIMRRMILNKCKTLTEYTEFLRENDKELNLLHKDLLINVTSFFREPAVYEALTNKIFPSLLKSRKENDMVRIWTPACANGEEAYSIAICLFEYLEDKAIRTPIQIFGTDLNENAIDKARAGVYRESELANVTPQQLQRYFIRTDGRYQIIKTIRDVCIFATHNLLEDPPFSRMDLISCQNVLIYLETNPQKKILQSFHYSLKATGYLLLGKSESIGNATELYAQVDKELKIYSKKETPHTALMFDFSARKPYLPSLSIMEKLNHEQFADIDVEKETGRLLLTHYVPASVVINKDLQILHFYGPTSDYLQPSTGRASFHLLKMIKDELVLELKGLISRAKSEGIAVQKEGIHLSINGKDKEISIEVAPVRSPVKDFYYLIVFRDVITFAPSPVPGKNKSRKINEDPKKERLNKLEHQLAESREYMKTMSEEFEATREELQSANEEVLSSNEELQSINEELETSKEELQSTNEELTTINEELQRRNNDLKEANDMFQAIIQTINEPLLVLTEDMRVLTANKAFSAAFKTSVDQIEGNYLFEMQHRQWNIEELRILLNDIIEKAASFENFEITHRFSIVGEKKLLVSGIRLQQEDIKKNRILLVIEDISNRKE